MTLDSFCKKNLIFGAFGVMGQLDRQLGDRLVKHYNRGLTEYGDTAQGALWPNEIDRRTRFGVMLDVIETSPATSIVLCDLGCGTGSLLSYIRERGLENITYIGVDYSAAALKLARAKFPGVTFIEMNIADPDADWDRISCDYLVCNGVFTGKMDISHKEMWLLLENTIKNAWYQVRRGLAFNVMSKVVDWERDDLLHVPMDDSVRLLHGLAGRNVRVRADYGLYEYTSYAFKRPADCVEATAPTTDFVPVLRPLLPSCDRLLPYLRRIDRARVYTNHGPLLAELEMRLSARFNLPVESVVCASSGTTALVGAILATAGRATAERPLALVPAFTFAATALAAEQCGYRPYLVDIDEATWALDPDKLALHPMLDQAGVVIPVAPFGRTIAQSGWMNFRNRTGVPVAIDAAASFDGLTQEPQSFVGTIPISLSFHATKSFSAGCGGAVVSSDCDLVARAGQALNFGFFHGRESESFGTNGKLSEYHAAVGLAELDGWHEKSAAMRTVINEYRAYLGEAGLAHRLVGAPEISVGYVLFRCVDADEAMRVRAGLQQHGVDHRLWYSHGLQHHSYFSQLKRDDLSITEAVAPCLIGLPMAPDLSTGQIAQVAAALCASVRMP